MDEPILLSTAVPAEAVDDVTGSAWLAGATGVAEEHVDGLDRVRLLVSCPAAAQAAVALALGGDACEVDSWTPVVKQVPVEFEGQLISLDVPANVFGDGAHPTTSTCLDLVSTLVLAEHRVLDLGCGAGLLTVAAALRGAAVTAVDTWEPAVEATKVNAERAGVAGHVSVESRSIEATDRADVVLANIGAATLIELAADIIAAADGPIVLSGLLERQAADVEGAFDTYRSERKTIDGWTTLTLRPAGS